MQTYIVSPIGYITIEAGSYGLIKIGFNGNIKPAINHYTPLLYEAKKQLTAYFEKKLTIFELPLELYGSEFQKKVWKETAKIPYGEVITYKKLSENIGNIFAYRAVGNALGKNPLPIVIPCHRVVSQNGLGGFSAPFYIKKYLLSIESSK